MMKSDGAWTEDQGAWAEADLPIMADLRLRLQGSQEQEAAARAEARRLARELAVAHRLLKFAGDGNLPMPPERVRPAAPPRPAEKVAPVNPRVRAVRLTEKVTYHLDTCETRGEYTAISGWAFRPAEGWDGRATTVTLLFRDGATVYAAPACRVARGDVAAFYAAQEAGLTGGAVGLDGAGFACEVWHDSLPAGVDLEIVLRLECAGRACEQPTGTPLRR